MDLVLPPTFIKYQMSVLWCNEVPKDSISVYGMNPGEEKVKGPGGLLYRRHCEPAPVPVVVCTISCPHLIQYLYFVKHQMTLVKWSSKGKQFSFTGRRGLIYTGGIVKLHQRWQQLCVGGPTSGTSSGSGRDVVGRPAAGRKSSCSLSWATSTRPPLWAGRKLDCPDRDSNQLQSM